MKKTNILSENRRLLRGAFVVLCAPLKSGNAKVIRAGQQVSPIDLGPQEWASLITHVKRWVVNLIRARTRRKNESKAALRAVIKAVRHTMVYVRHLRGGAPASRDKEVELAMLWTELAFELEDIGLERLAKRCNISGRYWSNPTQFDDDFLAQAGVRLEDIERFARVSLSELK